MIRFRNPILLFLLFVTACSTTGSRSNTEDDIQIIRDSDQALLMAENHRDFYKEWFNIPYVGIFRDSDSIVIASSGDLAYLIGKSHIDLKTEAGDKRLEGKYITVWQKFNNNWLCVAVSWSGND